MNVARKLPQHLERDWPTSAFELVIDGAIDERMPGGLRSSIT